MPPIRRAIAPFVFVLLTALLLSGRASAGEQQLQPPKPSRNTAVTQLAYLDAFDEVDKDNYAILLFKEEDTRKGEWRLRIWTQGVTRRTSVDPAKPGFRRLMAEAATAGSDYFTVGYQLQPRADDGRLMESRIYFDEATMQPRYLELHLAVRNADGSPAPSQVVKVDWPADIGQAPQQLVTAPEADRNHAIEELAYIHAYDVVSNKDYAYVAYKESSTKDGSWRIVIKPYAHVTAATIIEPDSNLLRNMIRDAANSGSDYLLHGFHLAASDNDPRRVENRIYFDRQLSPTHVELHVVTRNGDGSAKDEQVARFDWPR